LVREILVAPVFDVEPLKKIVREIIQPNTLKYDKEAFFNRSLYEELQKIGVMCSIVPRKFGGPDLPVSDLVWIARELSYGSSGCTGTLIGHLLGLSSVILYAEESLREQVLTNYMKNFSLWSFAMTEGGAGSDLMNIATNVVETSDGYVLNGEKNFITNATVSSQMCVFARHIGQDGKTVGISCFFVPGDTPGLVRGEALDKVGWRESNTGTLLFKDVHLPKNYLLGQPGEGLGILTHCLNRSKTLMAASSVGIAYRALDLVQDRLLSTQRFGKPLLEQAAIKHLLARLHTETEAAWLLICRSAAAWDAGLPAVKESSMAKLFAGRVGADVARHAMELFGARGFTNDYEVSKLYRDARSTEIIEGPSLVQELLIAKHVLKKVKKADAYTFTNNKRVA